MTQELVLVVLLSGLVGLIWVMTVAILSGDQPRARGHETGTSSGQRDDGQHREGGLKRRTIAA
jgi:hypothetical protein